MTGILHIVVAMKPLEGTFAENAVFHGVAGLNIDECRIGTEAVSTHSQGKNTAFPKRPTEKSVEESGRKTRQDLVDMSGREGRWPANIVHDGSEEVKKGFPETTSGKPGVKHGKNDGPAYGAESRLPGTMMGGFGDSGSAARFFHEAGEMEEG